MWLGVATSRTVVVFRIGSRSKGALVAMIGEGFLGWLVSDGYRAYRDHPRRQRCLAHLIRKAVALATGFYRNGARSARPDQGRRRWRGRGARQAPDQPPQMGLPMSSVRDRREGPGAGPRNPQRLGRGDRLRQQSQPTAHEQRRRAGPAPCRHRPPSELRHTNRRRQPLLCRRLECHRNLPQAWRRCLELRPRPHHRSQNWPSSPSHSHGSPRRLTRGM